MTVFEEDEELEEERPPDPMVEQAVGRLQTLFDAQPKRLFYSTQIETSLEREFFHWITGKGLVELGNSGRIQRIPDTIAGNQVNFYANLRHRYWRREYQVIEKLLRRLYDPDFAQAVGRHGELMFDAALGRAGFRAESQNTKTWQGTTWTRTNHNLDRIFIRDGLAYGAEIKNTQNYISRTELRTKLDLCEHIGVTPLFIMRFAPKSYIYDIVQRGGFALLFEEQMYPWGHAALLREVRATLGLKVAQPRDVKEGDIRRLVNWHERKANK